MGISSALCCAFFGRTDDRKVQTAVGRAETQTRCGTIANAHGFVRAMKSWRWLQGEPALPPAMLLAMSRRENTRDCVTLQNSNGRIMAPINATKG